MRASSTRRRRGEEQPGDGLAALLAAEARLAGELAAARSEAAAIVAAAGAPAGSAAADPAPDGAERAELAAVEAELERALAVIEEDLAHRLAAHAAVPGRLDELASRAVDRVISVLRGFP